MENRIEINGVWYVREDAITDPLDHLEAEEMDVTDSLSLNKNKMEYTNRYNDTYTFTLDEDNNILWRGAFEWCRFGMPNDYTKAYNQYLDDECYNDHCMTLEEFKAKLHKHWHDTDHKVRKYVMLVGSVKNKINMVDPSGGPYIEVGDEMGSFSEEFKGLVVSDIESMDGGYKLITTKGE